MVGRVEAGPKQSPKYLLNISYNSPTISGSFGFQQKMFGSALVICFLKFIIQSTFYFSLHFSDARGRASTETPKQPPKYFLQPSHNFRLFPFPTTNVRLSISSPPLIARDSWGHPGYPGGYPLICYLTYMALNGLLGLVRAFIRFLWPSEAPQDGSE